MFYSPLIEMAERLFYAIFPSMQYKDDKSLESRKVIAALTITTYILALVACCIIGNVIHYFSVNAQIIILCSLGVVSLFCIYKIFFANPMPTRRTPEYWVKWWHGEIPWYRFFITGNYGEVNNK